MIELVDWLMYARVIADMARSDMPGYVAINVSPRHFRSPDFADRLLSLVAAAGLAPSRLRIEITSGVAGRRAADQPEPEPVAPERGVLAQLDDFGTGFSALSYLHRFPIAALKIDHSFVADLNGDARAESVAVIRAIVALAGSLGIEIIAEGVEPGPAQRLLELGCTMRKASFSGVQSRRPEQVRRRSRFDPRSRWNAMWNRRPSCWRAAATGYRNSARRPQRSAPCALRAAARISSQSQPCICVPPRGASANAATAAAIPAIRPARPSCERRNGVSIKACWLRHPAVCSAAGWAISSAVPASGGVAVCRP